MDGISQGARDGDANMSMDGRNIAKSSDGDANMSMDGRNIAKSSDGGANMPLCP